ncbi:I78 family peptidase inhibitor [Vulcaniibacterium gelatinicum]|uniref:I78 family peptidase inhibitor n=1 Tax=Vulcaniibacterium gelatinicum TaxID=2598725 RepID=UPI0011CC88D6|nr:I78 family peptidase inhibitor [Vulcaniibacterium gelatinicum]
MRALACSFVTGCALAACAPMPPPPPAVAQCDASRAGWAVGQRPDPEVVERIRLDTGSRSARVLYPDTMVTMEFNPERVNVRVNERGAIVAITCG